MNNEKAIKIIKESAILHSYLYTHDELKEALNLAIKAIENEEKLLSMCDKCREYNGQTLIHIEDVRRILR